MTGSSRFAIAVHVLSLLAHEKDRPLTSEYIAGSVNTNPVVIRRVLGLLARANLVNSTEGAAGGTVLARPARLINLAEVFRAVEKRERFPLPRNRPNPLCPVGKRVQGVFRHELEQVEAAMDRELASVTVADVLAGIQEANRG